MYALHARVRARGERERVILRTMHGVILRCACAWCACMCAAWCADMVSMHGHLEEEHTTAG